MSEYQRGKIHDVLVRPVPKYVDERGWLAEAFRDDELEPEFQPTMTYLSLSRPGVCRGPHEHVDQADYFVFLGPSNFKLLLWDARKDSPTYLTMMKMVVGEDAPMAVLVPKGVVHGYKNVGGKDGLVVNSPNQLFMGEGKKHPIDEIRHEHIVDSPFDMDA